MPTGNTPVYARGGGKEQKDMCERASISHKRELWIMVPAPRDRLDAARKRRKDSPLSCVYMNINAASFTSCPIDGGIVPACWDGTWGNAANVLEIYDPDACTVLVTHRSVKTPL